MNDPHAQDPAPLANITLYYREGTSDKVYQASIVAAGNAGFTVNFAYGRRGSTLQTGTKTATPVPYARAKASYDKLVNAKIAKGYTPGEAGTPYQQPGGEARHSGIACQLLNDIGPADLARYTADDRFVMQEKHDGRRLLVRRQGNAVAGINRRGLVVALPATIEGAAASLESEQFIVDGEAVGDCLHAFDLLQLGDADLRPQPYRQRLAALTNLLGTLPGSSAIRLVETAATSAAKQALVERLRHDNREGVAIKDLHAPYTAGRPAADGPQLKLKFYATASCIVVAHNECRSVVLGVLEHGGDSNFVPCGSVTIPPNHAMPAVGALVEVRYLYAFPQSHVLYQPVYLGPREDLVREDCVLGQLKYKPAV